MGSGRVALEARLYLVIAGITEGTDGPADAAAKMLVEIIAAGVVVDGLHTAIAVRVGRKMA